MVESNNASDFNRLSLNYSNSSGSTESNSDNRNYDKEYDDSEHLKLLVESNYASLYLVNYYGKSYVLKRYNLNLKDSLREATVLNSIYNLKNRFVLDLCKNERNEILCEYCPNGDLVNIVECMQSLSISLSETSIRVMMSMILRSYQALYSLGYAHNDVKLDNVLVTESFILKLADFGFTKQIDSCCNDHSCTPEYAAPELLKGSKFDNGLSDVYSLGELMFVLTFGRFSKINSDEAKGKCGPCLISRLKHANLKARVFKKNSQGIQILAAMLNPDPEFRLHLSFLSNNLSGDEVQDELNHRVRRYFYLDLEYIPDDIWNEYIRNMKQ